MVRRTRPWAVFEQASLPGLCLSKHPSLFASSAARLFSRMLALLRFPCKSRSRAFLLRCIYPTNQPGSLRNASVCVACCVYVQRSACVQCLVDSQCCGCLSPACCTWFWSQRLHGHGSMQLPETMHRAMGGTLDLKPPEAGLQTIRLRALMLLRLLSPFIGASVLGLMEHAFKGTACTKTGALDWCWSASVLGLMVHAFSGRVSASHPKCTHQEACAAPPTPLCSRQDCLCNHPCVHAAARIREPGIQRLCWGTPHVPLHPPGTSPCTTIPCHCTTCRLPAACCLLPAQEPGSKNLRACMANDV